MLLPPSHSSTLIVQTSVSQTRKPLATPSAGITSQLEHLLCAGPVLGTGPSAVGQAQVAPALMSPHRSQATIPASLTSSLQTAWLPTSGCVAVNKPLDLSGPHGLLH